jgi:flagellar hook-length control protein FliK
MTIPDAGIALAVPAGNLAKKATSSPASGRTNVSKADSGAFDALVHDLTGNERSEWTAEGTQATAHPNQGQGSTGGRRSSRHHGVRPSAQGEHARPVLAGPETGQATKVESPAISIAGAASSDAVVEAGSTRRTPDSESISTALPIVVSCDGFRVQPPPRHVQIDRGRETSQLNGQQVGPAGSAAAGDAVPVGDLAEHIGVDVVQASEVVSPADPEHHSASPDRVADRTGGRLTPNSPTPSESKQNDGSRGVDARGFALAALRSALRANEEVSSKVSEMSIADVTVSDTESRLPTRHEQPAVVERGEGPAPQTVDRMFRGGLPGSTSTPGADDGVVAPEPSDLFESRIPFERPPAGRERAEAADAARTEAGARQQARAESVPALQAFDHVRTPVGLEALARNVTEPGGPPFDRWAQSAPVARGAQASAVAGQSPLEPLELQRAESRTQIGAQDLRDSVPANRDTRLQDATLRSDPFRSEVRPAALPVPASDRLERNANAATVNETKTFVELPGRITAERLLQAPPDAEGDATSGVEAIGERPRFDRQAAPVAVEEPRPDGHPSIDAGVPGDRAAALPAAKDPAQTIGPSRGSRVERARGDRTVSDAQARAEAPIPTVSDAPGASTGSDAAETQAAAAIDVRSAEAADIDDRAESRGDVKVRRDARSTAAPSWPQGSFDQRGSLQGVAAAAPARRATVTEGPGSAARPAAQTVRAIAAFQAAALSAQFPLPTASAAGLATAAAAAATAPLLAAELPGQIVQAIRLQADNGSGQVQMRLHPQFLGDVTVAIRVDEGGAVVASLQASALEVREWIRGNESVLRQALADQGLHLERLVVVDSDTPADEEQARQQDRGDRDREQAWRRQSRRPRDNATFELVL